jgi:hypothetical protein
MDQKERSEQDEQSKPSEQYPRRPAAKRQGEGTQGTMQDQAARTKRPALMALALWWSCWHSHSIYGRG